MCWCAFLLIASTLLFGRWMCEQLRQVTICTLLFSALGSLSLSLSRSFLLQHFGIRWLSVNLDSSPLKAKETDCLFLSLHWSIMADFDDICFDPIVHTGHRHDFRYAHLRQPIRCAKLECQCSDRKSNHSLLCSLLGIHLFSVRFPVSCSIDCDDRVVYHHHCDHMAKGFSCWNERWKKRRTERKIETASTFFVQPVHHQRYWSMRCFCRDWTNVLLQDDQFIESSIRNARSLGVIPRAKIKTIKMTLVIVIGECLILSLQTKDTMRHSVPLGVAKYLRRPSILSRSMTIQVILYSSIPSSIIPRFLGKDAPIPSQTPENDCPSCSSAHSTLPRRLCSLDKIGPEDKRDAFHCLADPISLYFFSSDADLVVLISFSFHGLLVTLLSVHHNALAQSNWKWPFDSSNIVSLLYELLSQSIDLLAFCNKLLPTMQVNKPCFERHIEYRLLAVLDEDLPRLLHRKIVNNLSSRWVVFVRRRWLLLARTWFVSQLDERSSRSSKTSMTNFLFPCCIDLCMSVSDDVCATMTFLYSIMSLTIFE